MINVSKFSPFGDFIKSIILTTVMDHLSSNVSPSPLLTYKVESSQIDTLVNDQEPSPL